MADEIPLYRRPLGEAPTALPLVDTSDPYGTVERTVEWGELLPVEYAGPTREDTLRVAALQAAATLLIAPTIDVNGIWQATPDDDIGRALFVADRFLEWLIPPLDLPEPTE